MRPVRIANVSGFYGDRLAAMREMVEGGPVDVITGDYLAELTMLILWKARRKDPSAGYAKTFLIQLEEVLGTVLDRRIRVVTNAGGLNPGGLATKIEELGVKLGLAPKVAYIEGDDITSRIPQLFAAGHEFTHLDTGRSLEETGITPVTANAYLGGWAIAEALAADADIVVCPRVTDASLVVGPAAWWHGWSRTDYDALAGAVAAGHVIECGPQATGGNYSWSQEIRGGRPPGYPIAVVYDDGSSVITKNEGTGGVVSIGTVTAQLLYEIASPKYPNPDVVAHFDTVELSQEADNQVRISGVRGSEPSDQLKVAIDYVGGFRNTMTFVLTGLDIEAKAAAAEERLFYLLGGKESFDEVDVQLLRFDTPDAPTNAQATAHLRITVKDADRSKVGRRFADAVVEMAVSSYAGLHVTTPPTDASEFGVYWPALVAADVVTQELVLPDRSRTIVEHSKGSAISAATDWTTLANPNSTAALPTVRAPLGLICDARSGDKGGNANVGLWVRDGEHYEWLRTYLTVERFRELLPEAASLAIHRYELANLRAVNFVVVGLLGNGVADCTRLDAQAKGLGEYIRSRHVDLPVVWVDDDLTRGGAA